jgi:DNA polymerase
VADLCFLDSETRSQSDVTVAGAYKYAHHPSTEGIVWGFAFDDAPCGVWSPDWAWQGRNDAAEPLIEHARSGGLLVAWNAYFDRWIWNAVMVPKYGWPKTEREQWLCAQAQAEANNLPGKLEKACEALRTRYKKDPKGPKLIKQLCNGTRHDWRMDFDGLPERMGHFRAYCARDVEAMRGIWQYTRPLTRVEWREYHASEAINDRGVAVDIQFARHARRYAEHEFQDINAQLAELTGLPGMTLSHHVQKAAWLHDALRPDEELQALCERRKKDSDDVRFSCDRPTREAVLEAITEPTHAERFHVEQADAIVQFLELIEAGNSAAVRKFTAIVKQEIAGRVHGG